MKSKLVRSLLIALVPITVVVYFSCKKSDLDLLPHGPTEASFFLQESDFTKAVIGVYGKMNDLYWYNGGEGYGGVASNANMLLLPGDDITCTDQNPFEIFGPIEPSNGRINEFYTACYQIIARANVVIEKVDGVAPGIYSTPNLSSYHKGEALFLRGFAYYYLWNFYGTSPLDTVRVKSKDQFFPPSTSGTQLLDQAISDFSAAAALLPVSWETANRGRVTKNSAFGMLGKAQVFKGSYTKSAADFAAALPAFASITGASLVPKFDDNFAFDTENNNESLFEYQASQAFGGDNVWLSNDFDNAIGNLSVYWGFYSGSQNYGQAKFVATTKLAGIFDPADPRKALTLDATNSIQKYVSRDQLDQVATGSVNNPRLLRLADVKLLQAEAILQSGGSTADAIKSINEVRARARNMVAGGLAPADLSVTETDPKVIMQWIMDERLRELAGEGQRWFDIRRWALQGIITLDNTFFSSLTSISYQSKNLYFPIPTGETDVNVNVIQNPGY